LIAQLPVLEPFAKPGVNAKRHTRWNRAEILLLILLFCAVFEGAARKWLLTGSSEARYVLYFSKDLVFAALILLCPPVAITPAPALFRKLVLAGTGMTACGAAIAAVHEINWVGAVLTLRATIVLPVMAMLAAPRLARVEVDRIAWLIAICTVVNFGVGGVQSALPPDHFLNTYSDSTLAVVAVGESVRASGTFSYITGLGVMSGFGVWAGMTLLSNSRRLGFWLGATTIVAAFGCGLVSISRGPIVVGVLMLTFWTISSGILRRRGLLAASVAVGLAALLLASGVSDLLQQYTTTIVERHMVAQEEESLADRTINPLLSTFDVAKEVPFGSGLGTEQVAAVWSATGTANFANLEAPWPRLVLETGILGMVGFAVTCVGALLTLWLAAKTACCAGRRSVAIATLVLAASFFLTDVIYNHISSGMLWPIIAMALGATVCRCGNGRLEPLPEDGQREMPVRFKMRQNRSAGH
jgi:hypothetical protein